MSNCLRVSIGSLLLGSALAASAQVSLLPSPFAGALSEDFESLTAVDGQPSVTCLGGQLTYSSPVDETAVFRYEDGWGLGSRGGLDPGTDGGDQFGAGNDGSSTDFTFDFATPMTEFGGYFASAAFAGSPTPVITFTFYDSANNPVGQDAWTTPDTNLLTWRGYTSTVGIARIVFSGGESVPFDNLQANPVPEPASAAVLALGALALRRRPKA